MQAALVMSAALAPAASLEAPAQGAQALADLSALVTSSSVAQAIGDALPAGSSQSSPLGALGVALALGALTLLPAAMLCCTHFVRFVVVLGFVRTGLGTPAAPPNQVITGLALMLTAFSAAPLAGALHHAALAPYLEGKLSATSALAAAAPTLRTYLVARTSERSLETFYSVSEEPSPATADDVPLRIAVPAFVLSELSTAFSIGLAILLPFLVIDLLAAIVLTALGMVMVPPYVVALPLKLLVFALIDGWHLVVEALLQGAAG